LAQGEPIVVRARGWEVNLASRELRADGIAIPIGGRAFEIVETLAASAGQLVSKDDLMRRVWPGAIVEDNTIQVHISAIRRALGADRDMLKTVAGRGYRLLGDWTIGRERAPVKRPSPEAVATVAHSFQTNFPVAASALIGRESAVLNLHNLLSAYRVVSLTGPGGIGKTVLASEVARRLFPTIESDVLLVELVSLSDPELVPSAVASVLGLQSSGNEMSPGSIARAIGSRKVLLVLDNCEHVIDAAATMADALVRLCANITVLTTSREALRIEGEFVYRVAPLEVPAEHLELSEELLAQSAVQLFLARVRSLRTDFGPQDEELSVIAAVCRRLDGIPLAIEFAAARAATLGIRQVSDLLSDRLALLTVGRRTALPRHQTLRATLDWSYDLLSESEQRLLRHLAIFPAGFTLEAADAVACNVESNGAVGISSLVSKSLVILDGSENARRWRLLETVRVYSLEKLSDSGALGAVTRRHAEFYLSLFAPFSNESNLRSAINDLNRYRREVDNLRAALNWAFSPDGDAALGVALAAATTDFWVAMSLVAESCDWASKALARIGEASGTPHEMALQCSLGFSLIFTKGSNAPAREALIRALFLARQFEDFDYRQRATCGLWLFSARAMALEDALAFAREYEEVARNHDLHSQATAAWLVGIPQTYLGSHIEANERLQWAIDHYPVERRDQDMIRFASDLRASALGHNTVNLLSLGLLEAATRAAMKAIEEARATSQPTVLCVALAWAGFLFLSLDELDRAADYGEHLTDHAYKHGHCPFHGLGLCISGTLAAKRGEPEAGIGPLRSGLAEIQEAVHLLFYPSFRTELGAALGAAGRIDDGLHEIDEALRLADKTNYRWFIPEILRTKGELLTLRGAEEWVSIENLFRQSMSQAGAQRAAYWELSSATSLATLMRNQHRDAEARTVLSLAYGRLTEGFSASRVKQAKSLLDQMK
jgi:non-specific serine/threonine protein kinase